MIGFSNAASFVAHGGRGVAPSRPQYCLRGVCSVRSSAASDSNDQGGGQISNQESGGADPTPTPAQGSGLSSEVPSYRKLVRNVDPEKPATGGALFAEARAGEVGGPTVGEGLGPRRARKAQVPKEEKAKKVSKAAVAQGQMSFADAWASQNRDRGGSNIDVWAIIALLTILTPITILIVAILTGAIPGFVTPSY